MHSQLLAVALLTAYGIAVPLNINLGAYSPALVVGDGEISFGGKADVASLMNALEGAAVNGAAANGQAAPAVGAQPAAGGGQAATPAAQPAVEGQQQAAQVASLQGMGKEIAPRVIRMEADKELLRRDLSGFNAALKYAAEAIKTTPEINLGTEASGVGILQRPGISASQAGGAAAEAGEAAAVVRQPAARRVKRGGEPRLKTTVTTMFVRGGPALADAEKRSIEEEALTKRSPSPALDGVSLNMAEGQVAELTFVETRAVDDDFEDENEEESDE
ncbi:hypothetical protein BJ875DRAFT_491906 [Amylocarpus encephaloides]|uniref:Uncharacterized protein n=1 Tax=Amylocarpus encephaloides TaxID=45428 RepID=A0A9P8CA28_9HELO|nr:hypothetical protein BJ875DRAFT_491906 [Amylocarpus encephaloides]